MKKLTVSSIALSAILLFSGCISIGSRDNQHCSDSLGKQLVDLKGAVAMGAITEAEYQTQKAKLLGNK